MLTKHEPIESWSRRLTVFLGTEDWKAHFYQSSGQPGLFGGPEEAVRHVDLAGISEYFMSRLREEFHAVLEPLPLLNSKNTPIYLLCFAVGNPKGSQTALKIASHILSK
jgi:three-Cys-motif partner protein